MREAVSRFIQCVSLANLSLSNKVKKKFVETLLESLRHPMVNIQECARLAFQSFFQNYCLRRQLWQKFVSTGGPPPPSDKKVCS